MIKTASECSKAFSTKQGDPKKTGWIYFWGFSERRKKKKKGENFCEVKTMKKLQGVISNLYTKQRNLSHHLRNSFFPLLKTKFSVN